jgi:hypothetical protein
MYTNTPKYEILNITHNTLSYNPVLDRKSKDEIHNILQVILEENYSELDQQYEK